MLRTFITDRGESLAITVAMGSRIGAGGQGQVYSARLAGEIVAVKLIKQADANKLKALQQLEERCGKVATLPHRLLYESKAGVRGALAGYIMRYVDSKRSLSAARLFNFEEICQLTRYTWKDAVFAALRLAESVAALHCHGVVIGDLNPENVIFEQQIVAGASSTWRAIVIDTDSFQIEEVNGRRHHCPVSRPLYTAPELIGTDFNLTWRQQSADNFSLAVLIYQLLLHDHPYDNAINTNEPDLDVTTKIRRGLYPHAMLAPTGLQASPYRPAPSQISATIEQAFRLSFSAHSNLHTSGLRPSASEWTQLLKQLHGQVVPCNRSQHHHHPHGMECLWCALDQRMGQAISIFPNPEQKPTTTAQKRSKKPNSATAPAPANIQLLTQYSTLYQQLLAQQQRCQRIFPLKAELAVRLLELEQSLAEVMDQYGNPAQLIDQAALELRLSSVRNWMSQVLGHRGKIAQRQHDLDKLVNFATATAAGVMHATTRLQQQHRYLLEQLAEIDTSTINHLCSDSDPQAVSTALLQRAVGLQEERWLGHQLEQESIRSWQIEGFGEGRLALLEGHGLLHGEHLRRNIDRLTALPGIGKGLQGRLKAKLDTVTTELMRHLSTRVWPLLLDDLLDSQAIDGISTLEGELQRLGTKVESVEQGLSDLRKGIAKQLIERDSRLQAYGALF